jgi:exopolysaccharide biosynthesis protein
MKKIFLLIFPVVLILYLFFAVKDNVLVNRTPSSPTPKVLGMPEDKKYTIFNWEDKDYAFELAKVEDIAKLSLYPNFQDKLSSSEFLEKYDCQFLVNGGFYTEDSFPTGLFIYNGIEVRSWRESALLNGLLSVNDFEIARITPDLPKDHLEIGLQTGPLLIENGDKLDLKLKNDKYARRVMAATTGSNELLFIVIFDPDSYVSGPYLADLPLILEKIEQISGLNFADAINLDGGAASMFYSKEQDIYLKEVSTAGSFFCWKN